MNNLEELLKTQLDINKKNLEMITSLQEQINILSAQIENNQKEIKYLKKVRL